MLFSIQTKKPAPWGNGQRIRFVPGVLCVDGVAVLTLIPALGVWQGRWETVQAAADRFLRLVLGGHILREEIPANLLELLYAQWRNEGKHHLIALMTAPDRVRYAHAIHCELDLERHTNPQQANRRAAFYAGFAFDDPFFD